VFARLEEGKTFSFTILGVRLIDKLKGEEGWRCGVAVERFATSGGP